MSEDETGSTGEPVASQRVGKLTIPQRILTALPNLDRQKPAPGSTSRPGAMSRVRAVPPPQKHDNGQKETLDGEAIEPDEVIPPGEEGEEEPAGAAAGTRSRPQRPARAASRGTGRNADLFPDMSNEELTHAIKRIDDRERLYALMSGPLGAAIGIALTVATIHTNPAVGHKGHVAPSTIWFEGGARVVFGAAVFGLAYTRRRSLVAFGLGFLGLTVLPFGIVFIGLAIWMLFRVSKYQKTLSARGVGPQRTRSTQSPSQAARAGASDARARARARSTAPRDRRGRKMPEPTGPAASKRYTPPKPVRPRPPAPS